MPVISRVKIGRVRPKAGNVALLPTHHSVERRQIDRAIRDVLDQHTDGLSGIAIVAWDGGGSWSADVVNFETSPLMRMDIPQFAARRLAHQVGEDVTVDRVKRMLGWD